MRTRKPIPEDTQHRVLDRSRRRCALCVHFDNDYGQKEGQIAHIDRDPSNADEDNLVYLCLPHHDDYDTKRRQTKNRTPREVKTARNRLYDFIERGGDLAASPQRPTGMEADRKMLAPTAPDIHFDETDQRCRTETKFNGVLDAVFFRLAIVNNTGSLQHACRGFAREVQRQDSSTIRDNMQLTWATFSYPLPTKLDLTDGEEQNLDVFFIAADGSIGFATPNFAQPGSIPADFFRSHGLYTFSVTVFSNNSKARTARLIFDWHGDWRNAHVSAEIG
jgi:hypothetical protein